MVIAERTSAHKVVAVFVFPKDIGRVHEMICVSIVAIVVTTSDEAYTST